jgi:hypothetical protein
MAESTSPAPGVTARAALVGAVKTYLGFLVLLLLVAEATLGAAGLSAKDPRNQALALQLMVVLLVGLAAVVTVVALKRPDVLMRTLGSEGAAEAERQRFLDQLYGEWAERVDGEGATALSVMEIRPDGVARSLVMSGTGYDSAGGESSFWKTIAIGINVGERKVLYYWEGTPLPVPVPKLEGYGEITFYGTGSVLEGRGWFSDANLGDPGSKIAKKGTFLQRLTADEARKWREARDPAARAKWTAEKLRRMAPAAPAARQVAAA